MAMPQHLVMVRHGESVHNKLNSRPPGDDSDDSSEILDLTPNWKFTLTQTGVEQAQQSGEFLARQMGHFGLALSDLRVLTSDYVRAVETAANSCMAMQNIRPGEALAGIRLEHRLRERHWGSYGRLTRKSQEEKHPNTFRERHDNPGLWVPDGGDENMQSMQNRFRNLLDTLHRMGEPKMVVLFSHGELMTAAKAVIEKANLANYSNPDYSIQNCGILWYTRVNPAQQASTDQSDFLRWRLSHNIKGYEDGAWADIGNTVTKTYSPQELLDYVNENGAN